MDSFKRIPISVRKYIKKQEIEKHKKKGINVRQETNEKNSHYGEFYFISKKEKSAIVDAEEFDKLIEYNWYLHSGGYPFRWSRENGKMKALYIHKEIMNPPKGKAIWFRDRNKLNLRKENLMVVTKPELSHLNRKKEASSKFRGIFWDNLKKKWVANIIFNKKIKYIGMFAKEKDAAFSHDYYAKKFYGDKAVLNFPEKDISLEEVQDLLQKEKKKTSRYRGVSYVNSTDCWRARIISDGASYDLGLYDTEEKAAKAYDKKASVLLGKRAHLNFPKVNSLKLSMVGS